MVEEIRKEIEVLNVPINLAEIFNIYEVKPKLLNPSKGCFSIRLISRNIKFKGLTGKLIVDREIAHCQWQMYLIEKESSKKQQNN